MKEFKKILKFTSAVKCTVSKEKDKYLSVASIDSLRQYLPDGIDIEKDVDFLPIAANAFVANRFNKNGDGVNTETAISIAENFAKRPINVEHNRHQTCGVILSHAYSEFGSNKPLTKEELNDYKKPFNVTLGGIIWRVVNEDIAQEIEESNDPDSEDYGKISFSWEIGYSDYNLVLIKGSSKNLEDGNIVTDEESKSKLEKYLKSNGGLGKVDDDTYVYNLPVGFVLPLGIGLTERPAADVNGVATVEQIEKSSEASNSEENNSQIINENVNSDRLHESMKIKIKKVEDLTDEVIKEVSASDIREFISEEIKENLKTMEESSLKTQKEKEEVIATQTSKIQELEQSNSELKVKNEELNKEIESIKLEISKLQEAEAARAKLAVFSSRMGELDSLYSFESEERQIVAQKIKDLDEPQFDTYKKELEILLKHKVKASLEEKNNKENSQRTVETVIDNGKKETITVPNTTTNEPSLQDKYRLAFDFENGFEFEVGSRRKR